MDVKEQIKKAEEDLTRVLGFFPRVDAKASAVLGVDIGMLALLALNSPSLKQMTCFTAAALGIPVTLIFWSIFHLFMNAFPQLDGGEQSLIYFREIAKRSEEDYKDAFHKQEQDGYLADLLGQIWRNSEILTKKFDHLKCAFYILAITAIPWTISLIALASLNAQSQTLIVK